MNAEPKPDATPNPRLDRKVWEALGHASPVRASGGFADRVLAATVAEAQERPVAPVIRWLHFGAPLAAAAALVLALGSDMLLPSHEATTDLDRLVRLEAAFTSLPDAADTSADIDPGLLDIASLDDPSKLTDDQLFALLY